MPAALLTPLLIVGMLATDPARPEAIAKKAEAARDADRIDEAINLYRQGTTVSPRWAEGWWNLGTLAYDKGSYPNAKAAFTRFTKLNPSAGPGFAFLGLCEYETRDYGPALEHIERGLKLGIPAGDALAKVARYHAALILTRAGQFESALQLFGQLAVQGAGDRDTVIATGIAGLRLAIPPEQLAEDKRELAYETGMAVRAGLARQEGEAKREFDALIARYPAQGELHDLYGRALVMSDPDAALREWKRELEISPTHVPARVEIAFEYLKRGQPEAALPYAKEAVNLAPDLFVAHNALGQILARTNDAAGAVKELEKARDLAPKSPETRVALASAYVKAGRTADAARERAEFQKLTAERDGPAR
ncbi:MAG TPA: tetratricopeptide repeat protein [Bryobacteraceae bacterium]|nr:tetratricopeptide repeat protein [Bryobacteraceae bacterium]